MLINSQPASPREERVEEKERRTRARARTRTRFYGDAREAVGGVAIGTVGVATTFYTARLHFPCERKKKKSTARARARPETREPPATPAQPQRKPKLLQPTKPPARSRSQQQIHKARHGNNNKRIGCSGKWKCTWWSEAQRRATTSSRRHWKIEMREARRGEKHEWVKL